MKPSEILKQLNALKEDYRRQLFVYTPEEPPYLYWVVVDVIAPNRDLAYYIVSVMYPDYETITIEDVPLQPDEL